MYYEINVTRATGYGRHVHFFATAERSITTEQELQEVLPALQKAFPEPTYQVTVSRWEKRGRDVTALYPVPSSK